jgi:hypothetical protein
MLRFLGLVALTTLLHSQDPYAIAPANYQLILDNDYVRISRARFQPGDKVPVHAHPGIPTAYVYLDDGGPIRFSHKTPPFTLVRPAVKAGSVRFNRNSQVETHEVEYLGNTPTEYLRIELKAVPAPPHRDARLKLDADFPWEDAQVRISRVQGKLERPAYPAVIVDVSGHSAQWIDPSNPGAPLPSSGAPESHSFVIVELKSDPTSKPRR